MCACGEKLALPVAAPSAEVRATCAACGSAYVLAGDVVRPLPDAEAA